MYYQYTKRDGKQSVIQRCQLQMVTPEAFIALITAFPPLVIIRKIILLPVYNGHYEHPKAPNHYKAYEHK